MYEDSSPQLVMSKADNPDTPGVEYKIGPAGSVWDPPPTEVTVDGGKRYVVDDVRSYLLEQKAAFEAAADAKNDELAELGAAFQAKRRERDQIDTTISVLVSLLTNLK